MEDKITISIEEYKELLIIKGKYEELKNNSYIQPLKWSEPTITKTWYGSGGSNQPLPEHPVEITC